MGQTVVVDAQLKDKAYAESLEKSIAADPVVQYMNRDAILKTIERNKKEMQASVKVLDFIEAARLRDENKELEKLLETR
jgi:excinuclease ABC subunit B